MRLTVLFLGVGLGVAAVSRAAQADDPQPAASAIAASSPEARARFDALIAAYRALPAYADHGAVTVLTAIGDRTALRTTPASIRFVRPNRLDVTTDLVRVVADGSSVHEVVIPLKTVRTIPSPEPFREAILRGGALGSVEFGGMAGLPLAHVLNLVIGVEPERLVNDFAPKLVVEPDQVIDGATYQVLRFDEADNHDWRLLIEPISGLIAHVELAIEGDATRSSVGGSTVQITAIRWSAGAVTTTPPDPDAFRFTPPPGYAAVLPLDAGQSIDEMLDKVLRKAGLGVRKP